MLLPYLDPVLTGLFGILGRTNRNDPSKLAENDHVMKGAIHEADQLSTARGSVPGDLPCVGSFRRGAAILRTLITVRAEVRPMATGFLERLTAILGIVAERPSNPHFNHYLFESLSAIVRYDTQTRTLNMDGRSGKLTRFREGGLPRTQVWCNLGARVRGRL